MESYSTLDPTPTAASGAASTLAVGVESRSAEQAVQQNNGTRPPQTSISAALAAARAEATANLPSAPRFPGEDGGRSLAEMAQRDLDAALQLLADRAQYITGASGAAIALRRGGKNDMLCRASSGSNAPELGALLSTEFGLSGESVRTRQALRCDDAERDARVNREVCRQLGIASVVVMPVVNDDGVLGVFELFSGTANAFGERDLSAVRRLSEMVETAVRLAHATESLPEKLKTIETSGPEVAAAANADEQVLDDDILEDYVVEDPKPILEVASAASKPAAPRPEPTVLDLPKAELPSPEPPRHQPASLEPTRMVSPAPVVAESRAAAQPVAPPVVTPAAAPAAKTTPVPAPTTPAPAAQTAAPKKQLFWSAALNPVADAAKVAEPDQSHVPPVLRSLRKCEACGFPISTGRVLCVECEEKKWRGQTRGPAPRKSSAAVWAVAQPEAHVLPSARPSAPVAAPDPSTVRAASINPVSAGAAPAPLGKSKEAGASAVAPVPAVNAAVPFPVAQPSRPSVGTSSPEFVLSAGLQPSESWLAANKYILGVLLVVAAVVATIFWLR